MDGLEGLGKLVVDTFDFISLLHVVDTYADATVGSRPGPGVRLAEIDCRFLPSMQFFLNLNWLGDFLNL